jgi:hypothetical protein
MEQLQDAYTIEVTNGPGFYLFTDGANTNFDGIFTGISAGVLYCRGYRW